MKVLVFLEQRDGKLKTSALEALTVAHKVAGGNAGDVVGLLIGDSVSALASEVKGYGADKVLVAEKPELAKYNVLHYASALEAACKHVAPDAVIGVASPMGKDLLPRIAARLDAGLLTDLVEVDLDSFSGGVKPMYAGKVLAKVSFAGSGLRMASIRPNSFAPEQTAGEAATEALDFSLDGKGLETVEIRKGAMEKADLTEANRIISGGRALGSAEKFDLLNACADVLGATVGASRAAVDSGYASHDMQVGQTGKTVNPQLYIACGISGQIQHMAGMRTSKVIVAVNTDPDAPIFSVADYGIVGDLFEVVPAMTEKFKEMLS